MTDFRFRLNQEHPLLNGLSITELNLPEVSYDLNAAAVDRDQSTDSEWRSEGSVTGYPSQRRKPLESRIDLI